MRIGCEGVAVDAVLAEADIAMARQPGDRIGCDPAPGEDRGGNSCRCAGEKFQRLSLPRGERSSFRLLGARRLVDGLRTSGCTNQSEANTQVRA